MQIPSEDLEKIELITVHTQVGDLIHMLQHISSDSLEKCVDSVPPEDKNTLMYHLMKDTLEFRKKIEKDFVNEYGEPFET